MDHFFSFFNKTGKKPIHGYLAVAIDDSPLLQHITRHLREESKFLPMELAVPPRERGAFHLTIAMFKNGLDENDVELLKKYFNGKKIDLKVTGHGKAVNGENQALYLSVEPLEVESLRDLITQLGLSFSSTTPHITFGVHETTRKDAHGVTKEKQFDLEPFTVSGTIRLKSGSHLLF